MKKNIWLGSDLYSNKYGIKADLGFQPAHIFELFLLIRILVHKQKKNQKDRRNIGRFHAFL